MKRFPVLFLSALCLAALCACTSKEAGTQAGRPMPEASPAPAPPSVVSEAPLSEPPNAPAALVISARQDSVKAWLGGYSWEYETGGGVRRGVEADACHPLDAVPDLPTLSLYPDAISQSKPNYVSLLFDFEPDSVSVVCWDLAASPDPETSGERVALDRNSGIFGFEIRAGDWVYMITAGCEQDRYEGLVNYAFRGQFPKLTVDPALFE